VHQEGEREKACRKDGKVVNFEKVQDAVSSLSKRGIASHEVQVLVLITSITKYLESFDVHNKSRLFFGNQSMRTARRRIV
jgi:hypothetical protein